MMRGTVAGALLAGAALMTPAAVSAQAAPAGLKVDRVVLLMRHGVRPPTKDPAMPAGTAAEGWPEWPTNPGWLTPHGAVAVGRLGAWDSARFRALGLLPAKGCPGPNAVQVVADSDQRTIATADNWIASALPGCGVKSEHKPQDEPDPIFGAIEAGLSPFDPAKADDAVAKAVGTGGIVAVEAQQRPLLNRLDAILCGGAKAACGVGGEPSKMVPASAGKRPKFTGALDRASTASQIMLLEYADGKAAKDVGWGRATVADIAALSAFHALEFRILARPAYVAAANMAGINPIIRKGLTGEARVTLISGHDTNVANLGGLLDAHWTVPGLATDDPAPGGALIMERLSDGKGAHYVRVIYRSQSLSQMRSGAPLSAKNAPYSAVLPIPGCAALGQKGLCTLAQFESRVNAQ